MTFSTVCDLKCAKAILKGLPMTQVASRLHMLCKFCVVIELIKIIAFISC